MIPKKPVPDLIRDGNRFSDKIMLQENVLIHDDQLNNGRSHERPFRFGRQQCRLKFVELPSANRAAAVSPPRRLFSPTRAGAATR